MKRVKIVTYAPLDIAHMIRKALGEAGAGEVGLYKYCSYSNKGVGRYLPGEGANPLIGEVGEFESVDEERIEVECERDKAKKVIELVKEVHPYEEVVVDVYPLLELDEL